MPLLTWPPNVGVLYMPTTATEGAVARTQKSAQQGGVQPRPSHTTGQAALGAQVADAEMVAAAADCLAAPVFSLADALHAILARNLHSLAAGQVAQGPILI